jgi:hypothetical protein
MTDDNPSSKKKPPSPEAVAAALTKFDLFASIEAANIFQNRLPVLNFVDTGEKWKLLSSSVDLDRIAQPNTELVNSFRSTGLAELQKKAFQIGLEPRDIVQFSWPERAEESKVLRTPSPLEAELKKLREDLDAASRALAEEKADKAEKERKLAEVHRALSALRSRERFAFLLNQIHPAARALLEGSEQFRQKFLEASDCKAYILSVDFGGRRTSC